MQTNPPMASLVNPLPQTNAEPGRFTQNDLKQELFGNSGPLGLEKFHTIDAAHNILQMDQSIGMGKAKSLAFANGSNEGQARPLHSNHDPIQLN